MRRAVLRKLWRNWSRVCWHWCLLHSRLCLVLMAPAAPTQFRLANIDHAGCLDVICNRPSRHLLWHSKVASCGYMCRCSMNGSKECFNFCFVYACRQAHVCKSRRMKDRQLQIARRDFVWYDWTCSAGSQDALRRLAPDSSGLLALFCVAALRHTPARNGAIVSNETIDRRR